MAFDSSTFACTPHKWLETRVRYEGTARAEFTNPPGTVEGPATVSFDSAGRCRVRLTVECIESPDRENFTLRPGGLLASYLVHGETNPCHSLTVNTGAGVFTGGDRILHDGSVNSEQQLVLRPIQSEYEVAGAAPARYWVLPLANFMPDPWIGDLLPQLDEHPLRLCSWPKIPDGLPANELAAAGFYLYHRASLFSFLLNGEPGFIERLPDYAERVKQVRRRRSRRITAVMVGPAHVQTIQWPDFTGLFPLDILSALSLATGTTVGAPWIEFRDDKGALVRRAHICFGAGRYERAQPAFNSYLLRNGPGYLVGKVLAAPDRGEKYLRAAMNHALSAVRPGTLEARFISLCRGFETLCRHHGFVKQDLLARLEPAQQASVKALLQEVGGKIRAMQKAETNPDRKAVLDSIASRAQGAAQTEKSLGLAIADLAAKFGFHDAEVLGAHLSSHPLPAGNTWPGVVSFYRNAATHEAFFDFSQRDDLYTILRVKHHLHDLLLRVLLKTIGYDGPYQSPIAPTTQKESVDWVKPTTPVAMLGYA